jgi:hypothetical protein
VRIGVFTPCYRGTVRIEQSYSLVRDVAWGMRVGHDVMPFHMAGCSIERARNYAVAHALERECDLLLMQDADVYVAGGESGLERLVGRWEETRAAVVAAAVPSRRGDFLNCDPQNEIGVFEGDVGTGLMLVDVRQVGEGPWFRYHYSEDGSLVVCGEDIAFCRLMRKRGRRVIVDSTIPTGHVDEAHLLHNPGAGIDGRRIGRDA